MLDIKSLERRWLKYKIKSFAPYIFVIFLLLSVMIAAIVWFNTEKSAHLPVVKDPINAHTKNLAAISSPAPIIDENTTIIEPSMDFIQSFQNIPTPTQTSTSTSTSIKNKSIQPVSSTPKIVKTPEYSPPAETSAITKSNHQDGSSLSINRNNESKLDINELQRRFKETSNANLGLFIARYYYDHGNYDEAYNYALKTNNINNRIDESWILFSKSLVKLGRTDQAKKTLQLYVSQSNSEAARTLLDSIERGNFK